MPSDAPNTAPYQPARAPRGASLSCKGWQQEGVLRMLLNCLDPEVAERPQDLVIGGAAGKAAADWENFHSIVASLRRMEVNECLILESGRLAGVSHAKSNSPRVFATSPGAAGQHGNWLYAGTQTELPVLYEVYASAATAHFGGTLAGKLVVGGGMGGAGGAQPLAAALNGAAFLGIDADAERIKRRVKSGYCEVMVNHLDEALRILKNAIRQSKSASIGLIGNCNEVFPELARRGVVPDLLTDYTPVEAGCRGRVPPLEKLGTRFIERSLDYLDSLSDDGWALTTWMALSGESRDITRLDELALELFPSVERIQRWLRTTGKYVRFQGMPARVAWLTSRHLRKFGSAGNNLVAQGEISAPILFGRRLPPSKAALAGSPLIENGSCWTWQGSSTVPNSPNQLAAQAIVADGSANVADLLLSLWPGA